MSTFRLKPADKTEHYRICEIGMGVWVKIRWDALSAWDISTAVLGPEAVPEERVNTVIRLATDYGIDWNVLDENEDPVPFTAEAFVQAANQEPGLLLALATKLLELRAAAWSREKKASELSPNGTRPEGSRDTADDATKSNSHAHEGYVGETASSAHT